MNTLAVEAPAKFPAGHLRIVYQPQPGIEGVYVLYKKSRRTRDELVEEWHWEVDGHHGVAESAPEATEEARQYIKEGKK